VLYDKSDKLIAARIAKDNQWRFPSDEKVPAKICGVLNDV
jgi:hypothetical protein